MLTATLIFNHILSTYTYVNNKRFIYYQPTYFQLIMQQATFET